MKTSNDTIQESNDVDKRILKKVKYNDNNDNNDNDQQVENDNDHQDKEMISLDNSGSDKKKKEQKQYIYGNYYGYYNYRTQDERFKFLIKEYFYQKKCLDIGCNLGNVTFHIAKEYEPSFITAIDIDRNLINGASKHLQQEKNSFYENQRNLKYNNNNNSSKVKTTTTTTNNKEIKEEIKNYKIPTTTICTSNQNISKQHFIPISFRLLPSIPIEGLSNQTQYPFNLLFHCQNILYSSKYDLENHYDVILGLSLSKWIHLNSGDEGIKKFFYKVYKLLKPGGIFIFEPQDFKGYSKRKNLTPLIRQNYNEIKFKPIDFIPFLIDTVKFTSFQEIYNPTNNNESESNEKKGFERSIYKIIK
ncbi:hypothetical protein CYY_004598 [Polysphondylium violaceum]|uniref:RNA methyltransferase n=1 Tax=Polysphondylium violaceum TaxID=133409 RepID=A0A8J4V097_9MYCE|nr:hypothetical protein CYY_004598 [Polysphondylium violaceum]